MKNKSARKWLPGFIIATALLQRISSVTQHANTVIPARIKRESSALMFFCLLFLCFACTHASAAGKGKVEKVNGITVITVEGTPYEMGFQQGSLLKEDINAIYQMYLYEKVLKGWVKEYSILGKGGPKAYNNPRGALLDFAKKSEKYIPPELVEEMKGLADGAGIKYEDVLIMSSHIDYFAVLCSTFVARGPYTKDGKLIEGRNLDWAQGGLKELDKYAAVMVFKPSNGNSFVSIGYPGFVGVLTGFNDKGIVAELNFSMATADENGGDGFPALVLMRKLIQDSSSIGDARNFLKGIKRMAGYNIVVVDAGKRDAELIEISAKNVGSVTLKNDVFVSTNHFISKELAGKNTKAGGFSSSPSSERFARLTQLAKDKKGAIDIEAAKVMMHDDGVQVPGTVQTIVLSPETWDLWFWSRNRAPEDFVHFKVDELLSLNNAPNNAAPAEKPAGEDKKNHAQSANFFTISEICNTLNTINAYDEMKECDDYANTVIDPSQVDKFISVIKRICGAESGDVQANCIKENLRSAYQAATE